MFLKNQVVLRIYSKIRDITLQAAFGRRILFDNAAKYLLLLFNYVCLGYRKTTNTHHYWKMFLKKVVF